MAIKETWLPSPAGVLGSLRNSEKFARAFGLSLAVAGWLLLAAVYPNDLMPYPHEAALATWGLVESGAALPNTLATLKSAILGFCAAMVVGLIIGIGMGLSDYGEGIFAPYVMFGLTMPGLVWAILTTLIFGFTVMPAIITVVMITFPYIAINIWKGVEAIDMDLIYMSEAFGVSRLTMLRRVILPSAAPALFGAFRFGVAVAWGGVTVVELFAASEGVGLQLYQSYQTFAFADAWGWAAIFMFIILTFEYGLMKPLERRVFSYRQDADFDLVG